MSTPQERIDRIRKETEEAASNWKYYADDAHVDRWGPDTAAEVLDLLTGMLERHTADDHTVHGWTCMHCEGVRWPCPDYQDAMAVLDRLEPEGTS